MKLRIALLAVVMIALGSAACAQEDAYDFAIIGDLPYNAFEREHLPALLDDVRASASRFVVHVGDIKDGSSTCSDAAMDEAFKLLAASPLPLIYAPGDNDWADCRREAAGRFQPLERLARLRKRFFAGSQSLGARTIELQRQSDEAGFEAFVENQRWQRGPVLFVTLHVIGGNNEMRRKVSKAESAAYTARESANRVWLAQAFGLARSNRLGAIVVFIHGNPRLKAYRRNHGPNGYTAFLRQLDQESSHFDGQVVLVHGDTHHQRIDLPEGAASKVDRLARLTRIETYGHPFMGWIQVSVRPDNRPLLGFEAHPYSPDAYRSPLP